MEQSLVVFTQFLLHFCELLMDSVGCGGEILTEDGRGHSEHLHETLMDQKMAVVSFSSLLNAGWRDIEDPL